MRRFLILFLIMAFVFAAAGLYAAQKAKTDALPKPDGQAFGRYVMKDNPYTGWKLFPGTQKFYKGTEPHGALLTTYVNDIYLKSVQKKEAPRAGSIIVKENYSPEKKLMAITAMYRVKGYDPKAGNWFWATINPDGSVKSSGKVDSCISCHKKAGKDFVFTQPK